MDDKNSILCKITFRNGHTGAIKLELGFLNENGISNFFLLMRITSFNLQIKVP